MGDEALTPPFCLYPRRLAPPLYLYPRRYG